MRVAILNQREYPQRWEVLTERVRATLAAEGHEVFVLCRELGTPAPQTDTIVPMIPPGKSSFWNRLKSVALPVNPYWVKWLRVQLLKLEIDVLIVRDLRLALPALRAGQRLGIPVILYFAENYAGMVRSYGRQRLAHWLLRQPRLVQALEFACARRADRVWVVAEENAERLKAAGVDPERIEIIHNVPDAAAKLPRIPLGERASQDPLLVLFAGQITEMRCLDRLLEGLALMSPADQARVKVLIFGDGETLPSLRALAKELGIEEQVVFAGWQPMQEIAARLAGRRCIGIVPHYVNELTDTTVPNKLFDYMAMGLPLLVTSARPLQRIVEDEGCGWATADTAEALARGLRTAAATPLAALQEMGARGFQAVRDRYNWAHYQDLIRRNVSSYSRA